MRLPSPRRSFRVRLLLAFLVTLGVLLGATLVAIRSETARQVAETSRRAVARAEAAFREAEAFRWGQLERIADPFTRGIRAVAAVEAAIQGGDFDALVEDVSYELDRNQLSPDSLMLAFADPEGRPVLTLIEGERDEAGDPASLEPLLEGLMAADEGVTRGYRVANGRLWAVQARALYLGPRPVGSVVLGFPLTDADAEAIGEVVGVEVCFVAAGACLAGTERARSDLAPLFERAVGELPEGLVHGPEGRWRLAAAPLDPVRPGDGSRVIALPMDAVLAPFERISRTLLLVGLLALVVAVAASALLARGLTRPIQVLVNAAGRVARGDYGAEVGLERQDELGSLGDAFDEMVRGLRLKERYRGVLDKVVSKEVAEELMRGDVVLGGEARTATVLFADLRGFTALTRDMPPHRVIDLLNECMETLSRAVDAEGGVVDKYIGDEIMAVWGAPVAADDDAARAARSACRMQAGIRAMNARRVERGEPAIGVGIGINTGRVVAGNMGSADRLNYTVLGTSVNLASRLCSVAGPGEVLISEATADVLPPELHTTPAGARTLKGFDEPVPVRAVPDAAELGGRVADRAGRPEDAVSGPGASAAEPSREGDGAADGGAPSGSLVVALLAAGAAVVAPLGAPLPATAQERALPTLQDLGAWWTTADGTFQAGLSGRLDLEGYLPDDGIFPGLVPTTDAFLAPRLRLFLDVFAGDAFYGLVELRTDRGDGPGDAEMEGAVEQLLVRWTPAPGASLQVGRFASPFGTYPVRHHTEADPFVRPPLFYDYRTMACSILVPPDRDRFLGWREEPDRFRPVGAPPVWGVPYQWGVMGMLPVGPVRLRGAWMNSSVSSEPAQWGFDSDRFDRGSLVAGAGVDLGPELTLDLSWSRGPYYDPDARLGGPLPEGTTLDDYDQEIWGLSATFSRGGWLVRGEGVLDRWEVPNAGDDFREVGWSVEVQRDLLPGLFVAGRLGGLDFLEQGDVSAPAGRPGRQEWDWEVVRLELGAGYRFARNAGVRAQAALTRPEGPVEPESGLLALQLWWAF